MHLTPGVRTQDFNALHHGPTCNDAIAIHICRTCWVEGHSGANGPCLDMHLEACVMSVLVCMPELTKYVAACKNAGLVRHLLPVLDTSLL